MGAIVIKHYFDVPEAFIARAYLRHNGIYATLKDEHFIQTNFYYARLLGEVKLQVFDSDLEEALSLLKDVEQNYIENDKNSCGNCGSTRTVRMYKYTYTQIPVLLYSIFLQFPLVLPPKKFSHLKCNLCKEKTYLVEDEIGDEGFDASSPDIVS